MQVLYLGRAPRTKETLPDFLKWRRITRHPLVFCGLTGSQRTPGFGASQILGIDWLSKHRAIIDYDKKTIVLRCSNQCLM